ncbi:MAG: hypothetical protein P4L50_10245 [Anaerolineaceae bacterium]|nr:hypothetical protein [Formivibrio sp.]MDR3574234.1 hypothetical protein [Anaerolineaceae bacterium]
MLILTAALFSLASARATRFMYEASEKIVDASCLAANQTDVIIRGNLKLGMVDPNLRENAAKLRAAGIAPLPYMTPCVRCDNAKEEVATVLNAMGTQPQAAIIHVTP